MALINEDVKQAGESSVPQNDVKAESSTEKKEGSEVQKDVKEPTLAEVAKAAYEKSIASEEKETESSAEGKSEDGSILSSNQTEEEAKDETKEEVESTEKSEEEKTEGEKEVNDKGPVPYERFQEKVKKAQEFETKVKEYEPLVQAHKSIVEYCQTNQISEEQFQQGMEMLKLVNTDPIAAKKALEPIWNQLNSLSGDSLPEDLASEVREGLISESRAKELARFRGQSKVSEAKVKLSNQEFNQQRQAQFVQQIESSVSAWSNAKQKNDPDFKPKTAANATDGKFEFVADRFYKLMASTPPKNGADAIRLVEQAYADVSKAFTAMKPKVNISSKGLSSTKSSSNSQKEPKSIADVVANVLAKHKA